AGNATMPAEHGNVFGTGPQPPVPYGFAFYYDTIELAEVPPVVVDPPATETPGGGTGSGGAGGGGAPAGPVVPLWRDYPGDRLTDDDQRERGEEYTSWYPFYIYYEGYDHYGPNGESVFTMPADTGGGPGSIIYDGDVLESQPQNPGEADGEEEEDGGIAAVL